MRAGQPGGLDQAAARLPPRRRKTSRGQEGCQSQGQSQGRCQGRGPLKVPTRTYHWPQRSAPPQTEQTPATITERCRLDRRPQGILGPALAWRRPEATFRSAQPADPLGIHPA
jgi:hypothetical protein